MKKYFKLYLKYSSNSFQRSFANPLAAFFLILGKLIKILLFLTIIGFITKGARVINGYTSEQVIFFYLTFVVVDSLSQLIFREVYRFRDLIRQGDFDLVLLPPINPLFRLLLAGADPLDLIVTIFIAGYAYFYALSNLSLHWSNLIIYLVLIVNGLLISTAIHIFILAIGILATDVSQLIWIYRDLSYLLRVPLNFYAEPLRYLLTFVIPLAIMISFPAQALFGLLSPLFLVVSFLITLIYLYLSLRFWGFALKKYQSASS